MLTSCSNCYEIVEIWNLNEHLVKECEDKDLFIECLECGLAIYRQEFTFHKN